MPRVTRDVRDHLMASNPEFRRLVEEHTQYEARLQQLSNDPYLSAEDLIYEMTLKKLKLRVKDEMEQLVAQHQQNSARR